MAKFEHLAAEFGGANQIPHDTLYEHYLQTRSGLIDLVQKNGVGCLETMDFAAEVRRRTKQNLFWMARYVTWETNPEGAGQPISENLVLEETHGRICDFFVQKDDAKSIAEQDEVKNRLLLFPRGGLKSTVDVVDSVQWVLNFPQIRILYLSAADDFAIGFVEETKGHFVIREAEPTMMNIFFSEFCYVDSGKVEDMYRFTSPEWSKRKIKRKEPTIMASSIGSTLSGYHFEVIKADDAVSNKNSTSADQCRQVTKNFNINRKMLRPFGYCDKVGTRYQDFDMYASDIEANVGDVRTRNDGPNVEIIENLSTNTKILIGRAITIKPERRKELEKEGLPVSYKEAGEEGCTLLVPRLWTYKKLLTEFATDEGAAESQLNQNPRPASMATFPKDMLVAKTVAFNEMPQSGPVSQTWDFAWSQKKGRDYCTGSNAVWNDKGQVFVNDLIRQRFRPADLAKEIVAFAKKWRPFVIGIENAAGAVSLEPTILAEALKTGDPYVIQVCSKIDWITPENQYDAKRARMGVMHPWLVNDRLKFANYIPFLSVLYDEFEKCMNSSSAHDDIPDVISRQLKYAPAMKAMIAKGINLGTASLHDIAWNLLFLEDCDAFGRPGMGAPPPIVQIEVEPELKESTPGFEPILGAGLFG